MVHKELKVLGENRVLRASKVYRDPLVLKVFKVLKVFLENQGQEILLLVYTLWRKVQGQLLVSWRKLMQSLPSLK
jgi:hypothetical protein